MGTRADFYEGRGLNAVWLGSIAWDGQDAPDVVAATTVEAFREAVGAIIADPDRGGATPDQGWPWPWKTSAQTDYHYAWDDGVWVGCFGRPYLQAAEFARIKAQDEDWEGDEPSEAERYYDLGKTEVFPNMKDRQNVALGSRSGTLAFALPGAPK